MRGYILVHGMVLTGGSPELRPWKYHARCRNERVYIRSGQDRGVT